MNNKKNSNYKNRGMWLENIINDSNAYYLEKDIALIYKKPTPIKVLNVSYPTRKTTIINKAVFKEFSTLDYVGIYKGKYIEFDAKECKNKTSFPLSNIKKHQLNHIQNVIKHGGISFLIIFINNVFILFKGESLLKFIKQNERKSIPFSYLLDNGYLIEEKYYPRLDYIKILDVCYFKEVKNEKL